MTAATTLDVPHVSARAVVRAALGRKAGRYARRPHGSADAATGHYQSACSIGDELLWRIWADVTLDGRGHGLLVVRYARNGTTHALGAQLVSEACHLGGVRWWALCPTCGRRCSDVYVRPDDRLACRVCLRLVYDSQGEGRLRRSFRRLRTLERRAGLPVGALGEGYAPKPARMHRSTWERLLSRAEGFTHRTDRAFTQRFGGGRW